MPTLKRDDGVNINFNVSGKGPALLLTHGYSVTSHMWHPQVAALSDKNTVITWDMRGHGQSDSPDDAILYSEKKTTGDMAALLDHVGVEKAVIAGLSLGGYSSFAFFRDYKARVAALMPFDCGPGYRSDEARGGWNNYAVSQAEKIEKDGFPWTEADAKRWGAHKSVRGIAMAARNMLIQKDSSVMDILPTIDVATMLIVGDHDKNFIEPMEYMSKKVPNSVKLMVPGCGHYPNLDRPELVNTAMRWFLDGPARGEASDWIGRGNPVRSRPDRTK
jgi:pimeloyl-ACP methyl ester carboxylesterase